MRKLLLSLALVLFGLNAAVAQSSLVATLSHEGNVSLFYGYNAFVDAMAAADHGDVITLSSGLFAPATITKAITVRGAAMFDDTEKNVLRTQINGNMDIRIPDDTEGKSLTVEYLWVNNYINNYSNLQNPKFQHIGCGWNCSFSITADYTSKMKNAIFSNVEGSIYIAYANGCSLTIINSNLKYIVYSENVKQCNVINSIVRDESYIFSNASYISFKNCIFPNPRGVLNGTNSCDHCLAIVEDGNANVLQNMIGTNWTVNSSSEIFTGEPNYVLTPTAAQTYLGTDGQQVGIWGGPMPWTTTAENPTITKCKVANRSTADGKLSVEIEVSGVQ